MPGRRLKRQLNLAQVIMLGTVGAIGAQIFVLTGIAAGIAGPAAVIALLIGGLLSYSVAFNYCELATAFPETGGAMTYVREAWGKNLLSFLVGSLDCLSSTFFCALSALGFAYSVQVFIPNLPLTLTAVVVIAVFSLLNILGAANVGNVQIVLGAGLLLIFAVYIAAGLMMPAGFSLEKFLAGGSFVIYRGTGTNIIKIMQTVALVYVAYIGFEVIADDAEEVKNPNRTIPMGILTSLTLVMVIYTLTMLATLGSVPWPELAGSQQALTLAASRFLPRIGKPMIFLAGIVAALTSVNTSMLSATREAFTLSRDGAWPRSLSWLSRLRTPYMAILFVGGVSSLVAWVGLVDFLAYISSSGYLFVLFWSSLALIRLRRIKPDLKRPYKTPLYPWTAYAAAASCFFIVAFTEMKALLFGAGLIGALCLYYYASRFTARLLAESEKEAESRRDRLLVAVAHPQKAAGLVRLGALIASGCGDTSLCIFTVIAMGRRGSATGANWLAERLSRKERALMAEAAAQAAAYNVPMYTKLRPAKDVCEGILEEIHSQKNLKLVLLGYPGDWNPADPKKNPVKFLIQKAPMNLAVFLDRGMGEIRQILSPFGGGPHSRLALHLALLLANAGEAHVTVLHLYPQGLDIEAIEDRMRWLEEVVHEELGRMPRHFLLRVHEAGSAPEGILEEIKQRRYDLVILGASEEWAQQTRLFGAADDWLVEQVNCSALLVRRHEPTPLHWLRQAAKKFETD